MSDLSDLRRDVEALNGTLKSIEDQQRQFNERVTSLISDVEACVHEIDLKLRRNRAEHQHIMQEYENAKSLLEKLNSFELRETASRRSSGNMRTFSGHDATEKRSDQIVDPETDPSPTRAYGSLGDDGETNPEQVRLGLQHILRKIGHEVPGSGGGEPKPGERRKRQAKP